MAERLVTLTELKEKLEEIIASVEGGETVVLIADRPGQPPARRVLLVGAAAYGLSPAPAPSAPPVEATVGGVAGGLVAGTGTTISSLTGNPNVAKGARKLGRRLGRALAVGIDALNEPKK